MKPKLSVVTRLHPGTSKGTRVREALISAGRTAKDYDLDTCMVVMSGRDEILAYSSAGCSYNDKVALLERMKHLLLRDGPC